MKIIKTLLFRIYSSTFLNIVDKADSVKKIVFLGLTLFLWSGLASNLQAQISYNSTKYCSTDPPTVFTTVATYYTGVYNSPGTGNCGFPSGTYDPNMFAAIDGNTSNDYQNGQACGACVAAHDSANGNSVTLMIIDNCATCSNAHQLDPFADSLHLPGRYHGRGPSQHYLELCPLPLEPDDGGLDREYHVPMEIGMQRFLRSNPIFRQLISYHKRQLQHGQRRPLHFLAVGR